MLVQDYNKFVVKTDQYKSRSAEERRAIALYGLVGEIGSLLAAVKKQLLAEGGAAAWDAPNDEIIEELGDVIWYCFSLAQILVPGGVNIFIRDIALLKKEIGADNERAKKIHAALDPSKKAQFLKAAEEFPNTKNMVFADYQKLAFLTARTNGRVLLEVCLAVLWQLGAELLRKTLPDIELTLNKSVADRKEITVLGEIAWHLAAVASLYGVSLDEIVEKNVEKAAFRSTANEPTALHDAEADAGQQFPRRFEIAFVSVGPDRARMYYKGAQLGDELTDNSYQNDGYRFHDVMHLANVAHLGWSPVLRGLMKLKRKRDPKIDEVEDGARAKIVEELVIKAIHSEGERLALKAQDGKQPRLFADKGQITFKLVKFLHELVRGLEVQKNNAKEWEDAIFEGARIFHALVEERQGTVIVDMEARKLDFRPEVSTGVRGVVCGAGAAMISLDGMICPSRVFTEPELRKLDDAAGGEGAFLLLAMKQAILDALDVPAPTEADFKMISVTPLDDKRVSVQAEGAAQARIWAKKAIDFRVSAARTETVLIAHALALADPKD